MQHERAMGGSRDETRRDDEEEQAESIPEDVELNMRCAWTGRRSEQIRTRRREQAQHHPRPSARPSAGRDPFLLVPALPPAPAPARTNGATTAATTDANTPAHAHAHDARSPMLPSSRPHLQTVIVAVIVVVVIVIVV